MKGSIAAVAAFAASASAACTSDYQGTFNIQTTALSSKRDALQVRTNPFCNRAPKQSRTDMNSAETRMRRHSHHQPQRRCSLRPHRPHWQRRLQPPVPIRPCPRPRRCHLHLRLPSLRRNHIVRGRIHHLLRLRLRLLLEPVRQQPGQPSGPVQQGADHGRRL